MKIVISFEYDTEARVCQVISTLPRPPFGEIRSVLHDSHLVYADDAKRALVRAINFAIKGKLDAITSAQGVR